MRVLTVLLALACGVAMADQSPSPAGAAVYIIKPAAGARVKSPVTVVFGLKGMGIAPAGVKFDNTGHHHLLIDSELPADLTQPLPVSDNIRHFGKGQTETTLDLPPGKHTLQLLFADYTHTPFVPNVASSRITITVTK
ncbi:MAG: DUF4399 domain-containing protein [Steroidobacterales bacterium]